MRLLFSLSFLSVKIIHDHFLLFFFPSVFEILTLAKPCEEKISQPMEIDETSIQSKLKSLRKFKF